MSIRFGVTIIFNVADIERTRAFYREYLRIQLNATTKKMATPTG
jgi:catechol 2,3-dioxygenase-like lactoylglutathione lyase family enzyme